MSFYKQAKVDLFANTYMVKGFSIKEIILFNINHLFVHSSIDIQILFDRIVYG